MERDWGYEFSKRAVPAEVKHVLRGANPHQVLILLDDIQLSGPRGEAIDITTLPIDVVEIIDVHRGPQGSRFGGGAQGGAIRIDNQIQIKVCEPNSVGIFWHVLWTWMRNFRRPVDGDSTLHSLQHRRRQF